MRNKGLKITALVLIISLLAAVFAFSAFAAETPEISIGSGEAKAGEEVSIDVKVKNFKAVAGIQLNIEYGNLEFKELTSDKLTDLVRGTDYKAENGSLRLVGVGDVDNSTYQMNGAINTDEEVVAFTVKFTVPSGAEANTVYDIKFAATGNVFGDSDQQLFTVNKSNGKVTVKRDYLVGDVDGDGKVNMKDATILSRYLAKWPGVTLANPDAADIDKDGKINMRDATILSRYLAKWGSDYSKYFE